MIKPNPNIFTDRLKKTKSDKKVVYIKQQNPLIKGTDNFSIAVDHNFFTHSVINFNNNHDDNNLLDKLEEINSLCLDIIDLLNIFNQGENKFFFMFIIPDNAADY